jgi:hypothetical protein
MSFFKPELPIDPTYIRFRDGFTKWIIEKLQYPGLRWAPWSGGGNWVAYTIAEWDFIDFGIIGPKSPIESRFTFDAPQYVWYWEQFKNDRDLPPVWSEINNVYARYKTVRSQAVWNPYDGSWREMRRRMEPPPPVPAPPPCPQTPRPEDEFKRKAGILYQEYRDGIITDEIYKVRLLELNREYS